MLDFNKRRTVKILGATPLLTIPMVGSAASEGLSSKRSLAEKSFPRAASRRGLPLDIQIIYTQAVPDNNVLFRNNTDEELVVSKFIPGHVYFANQMIDLNMVVGNSELRLAPEQSIALSYDVLSYDVLSYELVTASNTITTEYVWADQAIDSLSHETSIITLGAFIAGTHAVVYANSSQNLPS